MHSRWQERYIERNVARIPDGGTLVRVVIGPRRVGIIGVGRGRRFASGATD